MPQKDLCDLQVLAELMDRRFRGPFGWRFGWDGIIGLIPVMGDMITNAVSAYIILRAAQLRCPPSVLLRMAFNLLVENIVDIIPFFGNLFDFVWKANVKNVALAERFLSDPRGVRRNSRFMIFFMITALLAAAAGLAALSVFLLFKLVENL